MKNLTKFNLSLALISTLSLVGCGSGGGDDAPAVAPNTTTGVFIDSPVSGLSYTCSSGAVGVTNALGEYTCPSDNNITFSIGTLNLGSVPVASVITPYDLHTNDASAMINILQLLQTLDSDKDASNGIEISEASRNLFDGYSGTIDANDFDTVTSGLIGDPLITPQKALAHFNEVRAQRNMQAVGFRRTTSSYDSDADGVADRIHTYTYDGNGNLLTDSYDTNADGTTDNIHRYTYDGNGNRLTDIYDSDADLSADTRHTYTYDTEGNRLTDYYDGNLLTSAVDTRHTYTYDSRGNMLTDNYDANADLSADTRYTYTYDTAGNMLTNSYDANLLNSAADRIHTYTYDGNGNRLTDSYDNDADGTADQIHTYTYDSNGNRLTHNFDFDADGTADKFYTYTYDGNGNMLTDNYDSDGDGTVDRIYTYTYDSNGNMLTSNYDANANGAADSIITYTYEFAHIPSS